MPHKNQTTVNRLNLQPLNSLFLAFSILTAAISLAFGGLQNAAANKSDIGRPASAKAVVPLDTAVTTGAISGRVTAESDGSPLSSIGIRLYYDNGTSWDYGGSNTTDSKGEYIITGLPPGNYRVRFEDKDNAYVKEFYDDAPDLESANDVAVSVGNTTSGIDAALIETGTINGTVTAESDGSPLSGIDVRLYDFNGSAWLTLGFGQTDANGNYSFSGLRPGNFRLRFTDTANQFYKEEYYDNKPTFSRADDIPINSGDTVTADAVLTEIGTISGKVTAESDGSPLIDIGVNLFHLNGENWSAVGLERTDDNGRYEFIDVPSDTYRIRFFDFDTLYIIEFYDGAPDLESATDIQFQAPGSLSDIDAALVKNGFISGRVTAEAGGQPLSDIRACAWRHEENSWSFTSRCSYTDANGDYNIEGLTPDVYRVGFNDFSDVYAAKFYDNVTSVDAGTDIPFAWSTVTGIDAALAEHGHITGRVTAEDSGQPLEGIVVRSYVYQEPNWVYESYDTTDVNGDYDLGGMVTGNYRVYFEDISGDYADEYYDNALDLDSAADVPVILSETTPGINAELSKIRYGQISGMVTNEDGKPLEYIRVDAYHKNGSAWELYEYYAKTDEGGQYTLRLPAGTYRVKFSDTDPMWEQLWADEFFDDAPDLESATNIPVKEGETLSGIDAVLAPYPPPVNDDFDDAIEIVTLPYSELRDVSHATWAADDPLPPCRPNLYYNSVWYAFTPQQNGLLTVNTRGSDYDTVLVVWEGTRGNLTEVACNDDVPSQQEYDFVSEILDLPLKGKTTYFIEVTGWDGDEFPITYLTLNVDFIKEKASSITIAKQSNPPGTTVFKFGSTFGSFPLQDGESKVFKNLAAGDYFFREREISGWTLDQINCTGEDVSEGSDRVTIHLGDSEDVTCTFVNNRLSGTPDAGGPYSGDEGLAITLDASASKNKEFIKAYKWDCTSDGSFDISTNSPTGSSCTYDDDGVFMVTLQTVDIFDQEEKDTAQVEVKNVAPAVNAGPDKVAKVGETVQFSAAIVDPGIADTQTTSWDFGDGSVSVSGTAVTHIFAKAGEYITAVTVTDDDGGVGEDTLYVTVGEENAQFNSLLPIIMRS